MGKVVARQCGAYSRLRIHDDGAPGMAPDREILPGIAHIVESPLAVQPDQSLGLLPSGKVGGGVAGVHRVEDPQVQGDLLGILAVRRGGKHHGPPRRLGRLRQGQYRRVVGKQVDAQFGQLGQALLEVCPALHEPKQGRDCPDGPVLDRLEARLQQQVGAHQGLVEVDTERYGSLVHTLAVTSERDANGKRSERRVSRD